MKRNRLYRFDTLVENATTGGDYKPCIVMTSRLPDIIKKTHEIAGDTKVCRIDVSVDTVDINSIHIADTISFDEFIERTRLLAQKDMDTLVSYSDVAKIFDERAKDVIAHYVCESLKLQGHERKDMEWNIADYISVYGCLIKRGPIYDAESVQIIIPLNVDIGDKNLVARSMARYQGVYKDLKDRFSARRQHKPLKQEKSTESGV